MIWVISDGRRGIENQALGLAEALIQYQPNDIHTHILQAAPQFKALPPRLQLLLKSKPEDYGLKPPYPKIIVGCGRQAIAPLLAVKRAAGKAVFTIYVQNPRIKAKHFDLVIAPNHDKLTGKNIINMIGSPNRITEARVRKDMKYFAEPLRALKAPRIAVLIGGNSKSHSLDKVVHAKHMNAMHTVLAQKTSLMVTTSRRTPDWACADYRALAKSNSRVWYADGRGDNPYFAFLGSANAILVTEDSTNMLTEACASGKPVFTLPMEGKAGKFADLYTDLEQRCHLRPFTGIIDGPEHLPLDETARVAKIIHAQIHSHFDVI